MDEKSDCFFLHPDNESPNKQKSNKIRDEHTDVLIKIKTIKVLVLQQETKIKSLIKAKNTAFDMIRGWKLDIQSVREEIEHHDTNTLKNRTSIATLQEHMDNIPKGHRAITNKLEIYDIKLNTSSTLNTKPWALQSDTDKYPLLHSYERASHFSKLHCRINLAILNGNETADIQHFYDSINYVIMTTLTACSFLPDY